MMNSIVVLSVVSLFMVAPTYAKSVAESTPPIHRYKGPAPQKLNNRAAVTPSKTYINPARPVTPFTQWNTNNGYCGEVSIMQAAMNQGMWMSQYNARLICGTGLSQSGPDGFCSSNGGEANYNAQVLIENQNSGDAPFASAGLCLQNARLNYQLYPYANAASGLAGYKQYLSWIKSQTIAGRNVGIAILNRGGGDSQYDHEVTVTKIGTNHAANDANYYDDDVLFFEEHSHGGQAYTQGFTFQSLAKTREQANSSMNSYSILIPGPTVLSAAGGDGIHDNPRPIKASNYAFAVAGPLDPTNVTLPITVTIAGSTTNGQPNAAQSGSGFNFESPGLPSGCTNKTPASWMGITLNVVVTGLTPGKTYNLYEYDFNGIKGTGTAAALAIPDRDFNAHANMATRVTKFVAKTAGASQVVQTTSDKIVAFRCVASTAP